MRRYVLCGSITGCPEIVDQFRHRSWNNYDSGLPVLNVGWLEAPHPYPQGRASPQFIKALRRLCRYPIIMYKGYHICDFCGAIPRIKVLRPESGFENIGRGKDGSFRGAILERIAAWSQQLRGILARPKDAMLGSYNIEVVGEEAVYYAPGLILHYVEKHNYLPPQEFVDAVLAAKPSQVPRDPDGEAGRLGFAQDRSYNWYWPIMRRPDAERLIEHVLIFRHEHHTHAVQSELVKLGRSCVVGEMNLEKWVQGEVGINMGKLRPTTPHDAFPRLQCAFYLHAFATQDEMSDSIRDSGPHNIE